MIATALPPLPPVAAMVAMAARPEEAPLLRETQLDGILASVRADDVAREVGAPIACTIILDGPDAATATIDPVESLGEFDVLSIAAPRRLAPDRPLFAVDLVLSTLASGRVVPEPIGVRWLHDGAETTGRIEFPEFSVQSLLGEKVDPAQFRDIAGEIAIADPLDHWPWAAGAAALVLAGAVAWWLLRARPRAPIAPDAWALAELRRLELAGLPARGDFGRYYDDLTAVVRRYVALRYAIPADRQTSREFLDATRAHGEFPAEQAERLRALLRLADLVKFAQAEPTAAECGANLAEARAFVESTRPGPEDAPAPGEARR